MATTLDKDITRESTIKYDNREIQVTLTANQEISFKLKGMKSGVVSIKIEDLYKQLIGDASNGVSKPMATSSIPKKGSISLKRKQDEDYLNPMISLYDLRTNNLVTHMDMKVKLQLEALICDLLKKEIKVFS